MEQEFDLSGLVAARICHDIIGPIGAIFNGIEMHALTGVLGDDELALISDSSIASCVRLRTLRLAFGTGRSDWQEDSEKFKDLITAYAQEKRIDTGWIIPEVLASTQARALALGVLVIESFFPRGGTLCAEVEGDSVKIKMQGKLNAGSKEFLDMLREDYAGPLTSREVHFYLFGHRLKEMSQKLVLEFGEDNLEMGWGSA